MKGYGEHRFSNNAILDSFSNIHSEDAEISFIWFLEKYFIWGDDHGEAHLLILLQSQTLDRSFTCATFDPKWAGNQFAQLYNQKEWNLSLKNCKGLICLSEYMKKDLELLYPDIKHYSLKHPIAHRSSPESQFNLDAFHENARSSYQDIACVATNYFMSGNRR